DAEEARATLSRLVGGAPEVIEALEGAGLTTPRAIVDAGPAALQALPAVGDRAAKLYAAAEEWLATRARAAANEAAAASEAAAKEAAANEAAANEAAASEA